MQATQDLPLLRLLHKLFPGVIRKLFLMGDVPDRAG